MEWRLREKGKTERAAESGECNDPFWHARKTYNVPCTCSTWGPKTRATCRRARGHVTIHHTASVEEETTREASRLSLGAAMWRPRGSRRDGSSVRVADASVDNGSTLVM